MQKIIKKRNWAFVVYPESLPENWIDILQKTGAPIAISPLHDKDLNPDGEEKKAHYHCIISYSGPTSFNVVKALTTKLNAPNPIPLEQVRGYYRYLTHKDNPEKHQYDERDITWLNDFAIRDFVELKKSEVDRIKRELIEIVKLHKFYEYCDLVDYCNSLGLEHGEYFEVATNHTFFFNHYISSLRYKHEKKEEKEKKGNKERWG